MYGHTVKKTPLLYLNSEVKLHQAQLVLGFERTWES